MRTPAIRAFRTPALLGLLLLGLALAAACSPAATPTPTRFPTLTPTKLVTAVVTPKKYAAAPAISIDTKKKYTAVIATTKGTMTAQLFASEDPITVNNFVFLARDHFFDGIIFHRIIKTFMVQSGDPLGNGSGGPGYAFKDEPITREYVKGTLAMANSGPNTNGSQFFIMTQSSPLPKNYTIFGIVIEGLDTLDKIAATPVKAKPGTDGEVSLPLERVSIISVEIREE